MKLRIYVCVAGSFARNACHVVMVSPSHNMKKRNFHYFHNLHSALFIFFFKTYIYAPAVVLCIRTLHTELTHECPHWTHISLITYIWHWFWIHYIYKYIYIRWISVKLHAVWCAYHRNTLTPFLALHLHTHKHTIDCCSCSATFCLHNTKSARQFSSPSRPSPPPLCNPSLFFPHCSRAKRVYRNIYIMHHHNYQLSTSN